MSETFVITRATLGFARVCHVFWGHTFDPTGFAKLRHVTCDFFVFDRVALVRREEFLPGKVSYVAGKYLVYHK